MTGSKAGGTEWLRVRAGQAAKAVPVQPACNGEDAVDSQVERFLNEHKVRFAPKAQIPIELFDEKSSLQNQARDVPLIQENVDRYATSLRKGEYLPPVIVFPSGNRVTIIDGNNRYAAHKKIGSRFVPGFVIAADTPSETIQLLTVAANNGHGETPDLRWRKRQAAHLIGLGYLADKACAAAGITKSQLSQFVALQRADARAKQMRITTGWTDLPDSTRIALGRAQLDSVFYQSAKCTIDTGMDSKACEALLRDVKALLSENEQITHIARVSEERKLEARVRAATGATNRLSSAKQSLITAIGKIMHIDSAELARQTLTDHDRTLLIKRVDDVGIKLIELQVALSDAKVGLRDAG